MQKLVLTIDISMCTWSWTVSTLIIFDPLCEACLWKTDTRNFLIAPYNFFFRHFRKKTIWYLQSYLEWLSDSYVVALLMCKLLSDRQAGKKFTPILNLEAKPLESHLSNQWLTSRGVKTFLKLLAHEKLNLF